ncbi:STAS domain-containing protein [Streptomyces sp. 7R007]
MLARHAAGPPAAGLFRLDFSGLRCIDSWGLSALLLLLRRRADDSGSRLRLEDRPPFLDRLLDLTGTYDHLVASVQDADAQDRPGTG